jgi:hypothetical protein
VSVVDLNNAPIRHKPRFAFCFEILGAPPSRPVLVFLVNLVFVIVQNDLWVLFPSSDVNRT